MILRLYLVWMRRIVLEIWPLDYLISLLHVVLLFELSEWLDILLTLIIIWYNRLSIIRYNKLSIIRFWVFKLWLGLIESLMACKCILLLKFLSTQNRIWSKVINSIVLTLILLLLLSFKGKTRISIIWFLMALKTIKVRKIRFVLRLKSRC